MFATFIALLIPSATGFLFISWLVSDDPETGLLERLFLGPGFGFGLLSIEMFLFGFARIGFNLPMITAIQLLISAFFIYLIHQKNGGKITATLFRKRDTASVETRVRPWAYWLSVVIIIIITLKVAFVFYEGLLRPIYSYDSWSNWSSAAKFFYFEGGLLLDKADEHYFGTGYRRFMSYPLHAPMLQVWIGLWTGSFHEVFTKMWSPVYFTCLLGFLYTTIRGGARPQGSIPLSGFSFLQALR